MTRLLKGRTFIAALIIIGLLLVIARLYLPHWLKDYVNAQLNSIEGYSGSVADIDVYLLRGAYVIKQLNIMKDDGAQSTPFVSAKAVDLSIQWRALLNGRIVSEIYVDDAALNFILHDDAPVQTGAGVDWTKPVKALMPIDINVVQINSGQLTYTNYAPSPDVKLSIHSLNARVTNLRNVVSKQSPLPSEISVSGKSQGGGVLSAEGRLNILKETPDTDLAMQLEKVDLTAINAFANAHAGIDFVKGVLNIYSELVIKDGKISGYVKPLATNIEVVSLKQDDGPLEIIWESIASLFLELFENQSKDQFGAKVPLSGDLNDVESEGLAVVFSIFKNAFISAFEKDTDDSVSFSEVNVSGNKADDSRTNESEDDGGIRIEYEYPSEK